MKSKRDWQFYYISFGIRHPFSFFWTEVPILSIKPSMHLTIKETKLKLKSNKLKGNLKLKYIKISLRNGVSICPVTKFFVCFDVFHFSFFPN